jgi:hypothetical protein
MDLAFSAGFESYGTRVLVRSNDEDVLNDVIEIARSALLGNIKPCRQGPYPLIFDLIGSRELFDFVRNGELLTKGTSDFGSFRHLNALIRVSVGEYSEDLTFIHAGAVGWRGKGILLPGLSFSGKSTLVYELVKLGAQYYSDDFGILDDAGLLHSFPRDISMRTREKYYEIYEVDPSAIGGTKSSEPIPIGLVFLTKHQARSRWAPIMLSRGKGLFEVLPFILSIRQKPDLALQVLNSAATNAIFLTSLRGDAKVAARRLLELFDKTAF